MLLGIKDDEQDSLLSFLIEDTVNMIMAYCHIDVLPRQLESLVPKIAADMYRAKGYGDSKSPRAEVRANVPSHMPKPTMTRFSATIINALTRSENERGVFRVTSVFSDFYDKTVIIAEYEIDDYTGKTEKWWQSKRAIRFGYRMSNAYVLRYVRRRKGR